MSKKEKLKKLIERAQSGDSEAMSEIINRFKPLIRRYSNGSNRDDFSDELIKSLIKIVKKHKFV